MALSLTVTKRRPERVIDKIAQSVLGEPRNPKLMTLSRVIVEPLSRCMMLEPIYAPHNYRWGADSYNYVGLSEDDFLTLDYVFGRRGQHVMRREVNDTTPWNAYLSSSLPIAVNRGTYFSFFWWRPNKSIDNVDLDIFPRIEFGETHPTHGGFWAPLIFSISGDSMFDVHEAQWRTKQEWKDDPIGNLVPLSYSHPLESRERIIGPYNRWLTMWIQPLDESQFLVKADWLKDGGFLYRSDVEREYDLFPSGSTGLRCEYGGGAMWQICPCEYRLSGTGISQLNRRMVPDTTYPDIIKKEYLGADTTTTVTLLDDTDTLIEDGDEIESWKYKAALAGTGVDTPRLFRVDVEWDVALTAAEAQEVDVSADVMDIQVSLSQDNYGREGTLKLRNPGTPGTYDTWLHDPLLQFDIDLHGEDLMVAFGDTPSHEVYLIGSDTDRKYPVVSWHISDAWGLLQQAIIKDSPDYGDMMLSDAITTALKVAGWRDADLDIDECTFVLPKSDYGDKATSRAPDGIRVSELLARWHDDYARTWDMGVTRDGKIKFKKPGEIEISRTFYLSSTQAAAALVEAQDKYDEDGGDEPVAGDYEYYVEKGLQTTVNTRDYFNEIWVYGLDPRKQRVLSAVHMDARSMKDPTYENYLGLRRLAVYASEQLIRQDQVNWVLEEWKKFYGRLRKQATMRARLDPLLLAGDYVKIHGFAETWRIEHISQSIARGNVVPRLDQTVHTEYALMEWPVDDEDEGEE